MCDKIQVEMYLKLLSNIREGQQAEQGYKEILKKSVDNLICIFYV